MKIEDFIAKEHVIVGLAAQSKKQLLRELAAAAAEALDLDEREVFDTLLQREKLGSTGMGGGVGIPHGKLQKIGHVFGMVAVLDAPIDFDAVDDEPIDTVFVLLAPESAGADHLKALAKISRIVKTPGVLDEMRASTSPEAVYQALTQTSEQNAA